MLAVQEQKLAVELKQTEVALREAEHNQKIADKAIDAQAEDRKHARESVKQMRLHGLVFAGIALFLIVIFVLVALWMGKDNLVLDFAKMAFGFVGGLGASSAWARFKSKPAPLDDE